MKNEWTFMVFNACEHDIERIRALADDCTVAYFCYCRYRTYNDDFIIGFVQFVLGYESPCDLFTERTWLKQCTHINEALTYIKQFPGFTESGNLITEHGLPPLNEVDKVI